MLPFSKLKDLTLPLGAELMYDTGDDMGDKMATGTDDDVEITGISSDTRLLDNGNLFVALVGERLNGHDFIDKAIKMGASALLVNRDFAKDSTRYFTDDSAESSTEDSASKKQVAVPCLLVDDTKLAYGRLGLLSRMAWQGELVAVTGSSGKTTFKEMMGSVLAACKKEALLTYANNNNTIGVPLTLLKLEEKDEVAVIEIGTDHPGEIGYSAALAKPKIAVITNAGKAHLGGFGSVEKIAQEKGSLLTHLSADGVAIINADDEFCPLWQELAKDREILSFGKSEDSQVRLSKIISEDPSKQELIFEIALKEELLETLKVKNKSKNNTKLKKSDLSWRIEMNILGSHHCMNAAAVFAAGLCLGLPAKSIVQGLAAYQSPKGRLKYVPLGNAASESFLLDDTYNANPNSMAAALHALSRCRQAGAAQTKKNKRSKDNQRLSLIAILGDMHELGEDEALEHRRLGELAAHLSIDGVLACGKLSTEVVAGYQAVREEKSSQLGNKPVSGMSVSGDISRAKSSTKSGSKSLRNPLDVSSQTSSIFGDWAEAAQSFEDTEELNHYLAKIYSTEKDRLQKCAFLVKGSRAETMEKSMDFLINLFA